MSTKVCTAEYMLSTEVGTDMSRSWFPRVVAEAFLGSTKDGEIKRAPDPVTMIDGDLSWFNNSGEAQFVAVMVMRAPRSIATTSPVTVVLHDAWSYDIGITPMAQYPSVVQDTTGGRLQADRPSVGPKNVIYAKFFSDQDSSQVYQPVGVVPPNQAMQFRYLCAVQTPGVWVESSEFDSRYDAQARWARLIALASPAVI